MEPPGWRGWGCAGTCLVVPVCGWVSQSHALIPVLCPVASGSDMELCFIASLCLNLHPIELLWDCLIISNLVSVGDNLFENHVEPLAVGNVWHQLWFIGLL